jgi:maltose O-acetyltransferase
VPSPRTEKQKMLDGALYRASDEELVTDRMRAAALLRELNAESDPELRRATLARLFGRIGSNANVMPVFACDYGFNVVAGHNLFINYNCVMIDCAPIVIGDDVQLGPAVQIYTAHHPLDAAARREGLESASPVTIGDNVWIGGGAVICPGIVIGDDAVIGAGSVVTRDVPAGAVVAGNPARILREVLPRRDAGRTMA